MGIAQLAEHWTVAPAVAGSIPVSHPIFLNAHPSDLRVYNRLPLSVGPKAISQNSRLTLASHRTSVLVAPNACEGSPGDSAILPLRRPASGKV